MRNIKIAFRNLNRQRKRTILLGGAIAFGIMIVTIINGFTGSFIANVSENFSHLLAGHVFIEGFEKAEDSATISIIRDDHGLVDTLNSLDLPVKSLSKRTDFQGTLIFQGVSVSQNIVGSDWEKETYLKERLVLVEGNFDDLTKKDADGKQHGIILSKDIAKRLNVELKDKILVKLRTIHNQLNVGEFTVTAVCYDPGLFGSISAYANLSYVNELVQMGEGEYKTMGLFLDNITQINKTADTLYAALQGKVDMFERKENDEKDRNPFAAMMKQTEEEKWTGTRFRLYTLNDILSEVDQLVRLLNRVGLIILLVLFFIIMVGITNTFRMILFERIKEIGTMRALGMQKPDVNKLFLLEAFFLSVVGTIGGLFVAGVIMFVLSRIFFGLDTPIYILLKNGYMTFKLSPLQVLANAAIVSVLTILAAFLPTRKAAKMRPVEALHHIG